MFKSKKIKELEARVTALEEYIKIQIEEKQKEHDFTNPPVMGGRK